MRPCYLIFSLSLFSFISLVLEVIDSQTKMEVKDITSDLKIELSLTILHFYFPGYPGKSGKHF